MRIGVLTGGGDCPGLNAVIRAVVRKGIKAHGWEIVGFRNGWQGPIENLTKPIGLTDVEDILTTAAIPLAPGCALLSQPSGPPVNECWGANATGSGLITATNALSLTP